MKNNNDKTKTKSSKENEIDALCAIYPDGIKIIKKYEIIELFLESNKTINNYYCTLKLRIEYPFNYPNDAPKIDIIDKYFINDDEINQINNYIKQQINLRIEQKVEVVYEIVNYIQEFLNKKNSYVNSLNKKDNNSNDNINDHNLNFSNSNNNKNTDNETKSVESDGEYVLSFIDKKPSFLNNKKINRKLSKHLSIKNIKSLNSLSNSSITLKSKSSSLRNLNSFHKNSFDTFEEEENKQNNNNQNDEKDSLSLIVTSRFANDYKIIKKLGEGGGGTVFKVINNWDKNIYAIKIIPVYIYKSENEEKILLKVLNEGYVLSRLQHIHIVRYFQTWVEEYTEKIKLMLNKDDVFNESDTSIMNEISESSSNSGSVCQKKLLFIQMEYCEGNTLKELIEKKSLKENEKWELIREIIEALNYIHEKKNLIHRDIKPGNIFLDKNNQIKIGDFGLAKITKKFSEKKNFNLPQNKNKEYYSINFNNEIMTYNIGTKYYCSPEQEMSSNYTNKSDLFSLGIIIFEMFYDFKNLIERDRILRKIKEKHIFPENFNLLSKNLQELIKNLTDLDPEKRMSAKKLLNSDLIPLRLNEEEDIIKFKKMIHEKNSYIEKSIQILMNFKIDKIKNNEHDEKCGDNDNDKNNINQNFDFEAIENENKIFNCIYSIFNLNNNFFMKFNEIIKFNNYIQIFDSKIGKNILIEKNEIDYDNLYLKKNGSIYQKISSFDFFHNFFNNFNNNNEIIKYYLNKFVFLNFKEFYIIFQIWKNSIFEINEKFYIDNYQKIYFILENLKIDQKNIIIKINSTEIIDLIFDKTNFTSKEKYKILQNFNKYSNKIPKNINKNYFNLSGNFELLKVKLKSNKKFLDVINKIEGFFKLNFLWKKKIRNFYIKNIIFDLSLIPKNFNFYSGLFIQINMKNFNEQNIFIEAGQIDNLINFNNNDNLKGFIINIFPKNLYISHSFIFEKKYKIDLLILRKNNISNKDFDKFLKITNIKLNCQYDFIYKPLENFNVDFNLFFEYYQMKCILFIYNNNDVEINDNNIEKKKTKDENEKEKIIDEEFETEIINEEEFMCFEACDIIMDDKEKKQTYKKKEFTFDTLFKAINNYKNKSKKFNE